jgi:hypothetical protein
MTEPFFRESGLAINRFVYRDECLDPYLFTYYIFNFQTNFLDKIK